MDSVSGTALGTYRKSWEHFYVEAWTPFDNRNELELVCETIRLLLIERMFVLHQTRASRNSRCYASTIATGSRV